MDHLPQISLLHPSDHRSEPPASLSQTTFNDLSIDQTINAFEHDKQLRIDVRRVLLKLTTDPTVIRYRQAILQDLFKHPELASVFEQILPDITALTVYRRAVDRKKVVLQELAWRASELDYLVTCVTALSQAFDRLEGEIQSEGLRALQEVTQAVEQTRSYQTLKEELPDLLPKLRANVSVTIGVNLDRQLRPIEAVLLSVNTEKYRSAPFLNRLFTQVDDEFNGIGRVHRAPEDLYGEQGNKDYRKGADPLMAPLFRDLSDVLDKTIRPVEKALKKYLNLNAYFLENLRADIGFYVAALRLGQKMTEQGLPISFPQINALESRSFEALNAYNLNLARHLITQNPGMRGLGDQIVQNDVAMNESGRILVLTGPNQGGKTTFTQMVGIMQLMAQAGLFVPAESAVISPVDQIYTHYPIEENLEKGTGRFGDEAKRLGEIFDVASRDSLILLNEPFASTSPGEALYLAQDVVRVFRQIGLRVIFNTHLHELAASADEINRSVEGDSAVVSLVASRIHSDDEATQRSYKIMPGQPLGRSYAREIAAKYGIEYEQLQARLRQRGILSS